MALQRFNNLDKLNTSWSIKSTKKPVVEPIDYQKEQKENEI